MEAIGLLMDIKKFAVHDGPGIRTSIFLKGCPLRCIWCHNPEGISQKPEMAYYAHKCMGCGECVRVCGHGAHTMAGGTHLFVRENCTACAACEEVCLGEAMKLYGRRIDVAEAVRIVLEDRAFYEKSGGGATVSGGEPLLQAAYVQALFTALKGHGIHTAADTCGNVPWEAFEQVMPVTDLFLFDIKHIDSAAHRRLTGVGNGLIIGNLQKLSKAGAHIEIRMPLVPGCNDDEDTLRGIGTLLGGLAIERMKVLPYHSLARSKYASLGLTDTMPDTAPPTDGALEGRCISSKHTVYAPFQGGRSDG